MNNALSQYWTIGIVGLVSPLRRRQIDGPLEECRADPVATGIRSSAPEDQHCGRWLGNLLLLFGLLLGLAVRFGLSSLSTSLADAVVGSSDSATSPG